MYVFVPFLGDFLSMSDNDNIEQVANIIQFSSPFLGTFFQ